MNDNYIKKNIPRDRISPETAHNQANRILDCMHTNEVRQKYCYMDLVDPHCGKSIMKAAGGKSLTKGEKYEPRRGGGEDY
jgi:hypothetical protein